MHLSPEEKQSLVARYHTGNSAAEICADTGIVRSTCGPSRTHSRGLYCFQPIGMTGSLALAVPHRLYRGAGPNREPNEVVRGWKGRAT
jgi:hypothetical protein